MNESLHLNIADSSMVAEARRSAVRVANELKFSETDAGKAAIVATETATNLLKHAGHGEMIIQKTNSTHCGRLEIFSMDKGPGIGNLQHALSNGYSTKQTGGIGLGGIARLSSSFDIYSNPGRGTVAYSKMSSEKSNPQIIDVVGISVPLASEKFCGDSWACIRVNEKEELIIVADGVGHGELAHQAARKAIALFKEHQTESLSNILSEIHNGLHNTRGAAVAIASIDRSQQRVTYAGVGNISGYIMNVNGSTSMLSHNGTAGYEVSRIQEFQYPISPDSVIVLHSDGILSRWDLQSFPGIYRKHSGVMAALIFREYRRERDDATVVVAKQTRTDSLK